MRFPGQHFNVFTLRALRIVFRILDRAISPSVSQHVEVIGREWTGGYDTLLQRKRLEAFRYGKLPFDVQIDVPEILYS
jgi:hypothetical protein